MGGRLDDVVGGPLPPVGEWGESPPRLDLYESVRALVAQKQLAPPKEVGRRLVQDGRRAQGLFNPHLTESEWHRRLGWMRGYVGNLQVAEGLMQVDDGEVSFWVWRCSAWLLSHEGRVEDRHELLQRWQRRVGLSTAHERALRAQLTHCLDVGQTDEAEGLARSSGSGGRVGIGWTAVLSSHAPSTAVFRRERWGLESARVYTPKGRVVVSSGEAFRRLGQVVAAEASYEEALEWPYAAWWRNGARNMLSLPSAAWRSETSPDRI